MSRSSPPPTAKKPLKSEANAGRLVGVFGLRGELKLAASRVGEDALEIGIVVQARLKDGSARPLRVRSLRYHQRRPLLAFEGVDDATAAEPLVGAELWLDRTSVVLARDEYFDDDLVGCTLVGSDDAPLGTVVRVEHYPAQDVLIVERGGKPSAMVPLVRAFVKHVDVPAKRIVVDVPSGLLESEEAEEA